jgi:CheY-like chemotaxis protein
MNGWRWSALTRCSPPPAASPSSDRRPIPESALEFLRSHPVEVLFLDIQMPGLTGFQLLEQLDTEAAVVFTTAYDRYAIEAFSVNSVDYLLKPIEPERLDKALDKLTRFAGSRGRTCARSRASWPPSSRRTAGWSGSRRGSASARKCSRSRASVISRRRTS